MPTRPEQHHNQITQELLSAAADQDAKFTFQAIKTYTNGYPQREIRSLQVVEEDPGGLPIKNGMLWIADLSQYGDVPLSRKEALEIADEIVWQLD